MHIKKGNPRKSALITPLIIRLAIILPSFASIRPIPGQLYIGAQDDTILTLERRGETDPI